MVQNLFENLPSEIKIDILARLPITTITCCKCVCKSWLNSLETHEFVKIHLSKSIPGLVACQLGCGSNFYKIFEFEDGFHLKRSDRFRFSRVTKFHLPWRGLINGSANGLLFLCDVFSDPYAHVICNPVTHGYIRLDKPSINKNSDVILYRYGFGVSRMSEEYKVVSITQNYMDENTQKLGIIPKSYCHVYTLGKGSWRSIKPGVPFTKSHGSIGAIFLNGSLHWMIIDFNDFARISSFDLETEAFSTVSIPFLVGHQRHFPGLSALGNFLCLCDDSSENEIVIWLLKECGNAESWTKEFVIKKDFDLCGMSHAVKLFRNGGILMTRLSYLIYYCNETTAIQEMKEPQLRSYGFMHAIPHTSSFVSLESFATENVMQLDNAAIVLCTQFLTS